MKEYKINAKYYRLDLFDKIRNSHQAYLLGYLLGDGNFHNKTKKRKARIGVTSSYEPTITYFKNMYCPDVTVTHLIPINNTKGYNIKTDKMSHRFVFSSLFSEVFNKYGLLSLKKDRIITNIPKDMFRYYLLGLFDADGFVSWGRRKDKNRIWVKFVITHQSYQVLNYIKNFLENEFDFKIFIKHRKTEKCIDLVFSKRESVYKFYDFMYKDCDVEYNKNKYDIWTKYVKEYEEYLL